MINTIARDTEQPAQPDNPKEAPSPAKQSFPAQIGIKYTLVADEKSDATHFYEKSGKRIAIHDRHTALATTFESPNIIKDMVAIAHHRGWASVKVSGSEAFRQAAWVEARALGLTVSGYTPSPLDLARLEEAQKLARSPVKQATLRNGNAALEKQADVLKSVASPVPAHEHELKAINSETEKLARKWLKAAPHIRAGDPLLTNAQSRFVVLKAAIAVAFKGDQDLIDNMTQLARVGIGEELAQGRIFKPQMAAAMPVESIAKPKPSKEVVRRPRMN